MKENGRKGERENEIRVKLLSTHVKNNFIYLSLTKHNLKIC